MKVDDVLDYINSLYPEYIDDYGVYSTLHDLVAKLKDGESRKDAEAALAQIKE